MFTHCFTTDGPVAAELARFEQLEPRTLLSHAAHPVAASVTNLVSDGVITAAHVDPNLVNSWGIVINPATGNLLVSDNGTGMATQYRPDGTSIGSPITIPAPDGGTSAPTGVAINGGRDLLVSGNGRSGPAQFLFATEDGTIAAYNSSVDAANAVTVFDSTSTGAVFKGITTARAGRQTMVYAADFHNGKIVVLDNTFHVASDASHFTFQDTNIPAGFVPFNVQGIGDRLFVTYAKQDAAAKDDVPGPGNGFVDVYSTRGKLLKRFASGGTLDSPWGVVKAPGRFGGDILIGNFGDGKITAFRSSGKVIGQLQDTSGNPVTLEGLWGMTLGSSKSNRQTLYFASGPNDEADGLVGSLTANKT